MFPYKKAHYEKLLENQDISMADMEIHEHMIVEGKTSTLKNSVLHYDFNNLSRYIQKHNEYSSWEAKVFLEGRSKDINPSLFGNTRNRRRWIKRKVLNNRLFPFLYFVFEYFFKLGFLDGKEGFYFIALKMNYYSDVNAKIYEFKKAILKD